MTEASPGLQGVGDMGLNRISLVQYRGHSTLSPGGGTGIQI